MCRLYVRREPRDWWCCRIDGSGDSGGYCSGLGLLQRGPGGQEDHPALVETYRQNMCLANMDVGISPNVRGYWDSDPLSANVILQQSAGRD